MILGEEGGSVENVLAAECSAFKRMESKIDEEEAKQKL